MMNRSGYSSHHGFAIMPAPDVYPEYYCVVYRLIPLALSLKGVEWRETRQNSKKRGSSQKLNTMRLIEFTSHIDRLMRTGNDFERREPFSDGALEKYGEAIQNSIQALRIKGAEEERQQQLMKLCGHLARIVLRSVRKGKILGDQKSVCPLFKRSAISKVDLVRFQDVCVEQADRQPLSEVYELCRNLVRP